MHDRYLKFWAKKVLVAPEQAVVPLKSVDYQLASKFEVGSGDVEVWGRGGMKLCMRAGGGATVVCGLAAGL